MQQAGIVYAAEQIIDLMANGVARERVDGLYQVFIQNLASKAKVEVLNTDIVDRVNL